MKSFYLNSLQIDFLFYFREPGKWPLQCSEISAKQSTLDEKYIKNFLPLLKDIFLLDGKFKKP
ncbi:MAG: hypothetical protein A2W90_22340 [Bacteroidetes bacterium GWF2_42_66]|nr:MAG: hypothetical protein A2W92_13715 [Bacteroidetes bacterium GWA2_42_15]OFY02205.1 MAG: hypothetical protein A2W89_11460 [Bacteroidetes bacterium GWE2_42_39]OFY43652.1 MAG: hypothetical protein A2W90_22340 [Bacteroidetes bacterium GWF2_42_66]HBL75286.1 hypothetical protein [Prolixibacteraceae bacterium]HCR90419.1 hypothetical protein [Prolixibacteraceae bacterium]